MRAIIDSDVLIDYLQGIEKAKRELESLCEARDQHHFLDGSHDGRRYS